MTVSVSQLSECLHYDAGTGLLHRLKGRGRGAAGCTVYVHISTSGYRMINVCRHRLFEHRVIWALHYGEWPNGEIDHIDGNAKNNRLDNLRVVTHLENGR